MPTCLTSLTSLIQSIPVYNGSEGGHKEKKIRNDDLAGRVLIPLLRPQAVTRILCEAVFVGQVLIPHLRHWVVMRILHEAVLAGWVLIPRLQHQVVTRIFLEVALVGQILVRMSMAPWQWLRPLNRRLPNWSFFCPFSSWFVS